MLLALFRSTPSTLAGFFTQILVAACDILAQAIVRKSSISLHRDFVLGRVRVEFRSPNTVPELLSSSFHVY